MIFTDLQAAFALSQGTSTSPASPSTLRCSIEASRTHQTVSRRSMIRLLGLVPIATAIAGPGASTAATADYDRFAATYEKLDGLTALTGFVGFDTLRTLALSRAHGDVIELCVGTGVNLPLYDNQSVTSLTGLDASIGMLERAEARASTLGSGPQKYFMRGDATDTGLPSSSFDTVVATFALCVVDQPGAMLHEMRRLVKPQGSVLLVDYTLSERNGALAAYQRVVGPLVATLSKGCAPDLDIPRLAADAGLREVWRQDVLDGAVIAIQLSLV